MTNKEDKQKSEKIVPKPSDFVENEDGTQRIPCKEDIRRVLDTHPPPDKPPKK